MKLTNKILALIILVLIGCDSKNPTKKTEEITDSSPGEIFELVDNIYYNDTAPEYAKRRYFKNTILSHNNKVRLKYEITVNYENKVDQVHCYFGKIEPTEQDSFVEAPIPFNIILANLKLKYKLQTKKSEASLLRQQWINKSQEYLLAQQEFTENYNGDDEFNSIMRFANTNLFLSQDGQVIIILYGDTNLQNATSITYKSYKDWIYEIDNEIKMKNLIINQKIEDNGL